MKARRLISCRASSFPADSDMRAKRLRRDRLPTTRRGANLVELVLVLVIITILAAIAVPRYASGLSRRRTEEAAKRIAADLALAREQARISGSSRLVQFMLGSSSYALQAVRDMDHPATDYVVSLLDAPYHAFLVSADFGEDTEIVFDGYGQPDTGGSVVVQVGDCYRTITVDADTGQASVQ